MHSFLNAGTTRVIMWVCLSVSDLVEEHFALLAQKSCRAIITLPVCSPATLEYVAEKERYWTGERFMKHVENGANSRFQVQQGAVHTGEAV